MSTKDAGSRFDCQAPSRVALFAVPDNAEALEAALVEVGFDAVMPDRLSFETAAEVDLIICDAARLDAIPETMREGRKQCGRPRPLFVGLCHSEDACSAMQQAGADLMLSGHCAPDLLADQLAALVSRLHVERDRNPLTGLPGNRWLQGHLQTLLGEGRSVGLLLLDIDRFKKFNDRHGHLTGDRVIGMLAECAVEAASRHEDCLVTHVGGDDFCLIATPEMLEELALKVLDEYRRRGVSVAGDWGERPPSISVVGSTVCGGPDVDLAAAFRGLARLKEKAKAQPGSTFILDDGTATR